jgi:hypothetical protein
VRAQGWYRDPYGIHGQRWISAGHATSLVRDDGVESRDEPPHGTPLVPEDHWRAAAEPQARLGREDAVRPSIWSSLGPWLRFALIALTFLVLIAAVIFIFLAWAVSSVMSGFT